MMHLVWRRRRHDGRPVASIEMEYQTPNNAAQRARATLTGEVALQVDQRHQTLALADLARLYPMPAKVLERAP